MGIRESIKKNRKAIITTAVITALAMYLTDKYQIVYRHDVREIRDMLSELVSLGYIKAENNTLHIVTGLVKPTL